MRISGTKRARPSLIAVGCWANDDGPTEMISSASEGTIFDTCGIFLPIKRNKRTEKEFWIYQKNSIPVCSHMFSDISLEKKENIYILASMSDYITNSKNRKLKTKILLFLSRINIWAGKLPLSGRAIILLECVLFGSLFFPWLNLRYLDELEPIAYTAFSQFCLYIGYGILLAIAIVPFFLLSHTKKERIRAIVPFRLSDTQAIVFIMSILLVSLINLIIINGLYSSQIAAQGSTLTVGFRIALSSVISILVATYFFSRSNKVANTDIYYLDHQIDDELSKYKHILGQDDENKKKNMSLPI